MNKNNFKFWHSVAGTLLLILIEYVAIRYLPAEIGIPTILAIAAIGSFIAVYVATEIIKEERGAFWMIVLLVAVVMQFVVFFAFEYMFLIMIQPGSFPTLTTDATTLLLHSVMIFVFNPLYIPATSAGRILLLIQTFAALGLAMFVLQNINEFRHKSFDKEKS